MSVVQKRDDGSLRCEVGECSGKALKQPHTWWLTVWSRATDSGDAVQQRCQIVEIPTAQPGHVFRRQSAKVVLERLRPDSERCGSTKRESPRREADRFPSIARQELAREARLADTRISEEKDHSELTCRRQPTLTLQLS